MLRQLLHAKGSGEADTSPARLGLAMGLCLACGFCTSVGATMPFFVKSKNSKMMAFALGLSSGVMIYVSFMELLAESSMHEMAEHLEHAWLAKHPEFEHEEDHRRKLLDGDHPEDKAHTEDEHAHEEEEDHPDFESQGYRYSTLTFFAGLLFMWLLERFVRCVQEREKVWAFLRGKPTAQADCVEHLHALEAQDPEDVLALQSKLEGKRTGSESEEERAHQNMFHPELHMEAYADEHRSGWERFKARCRYAYNATFFDVETQELRGGAVEAFKSMKFENKDEEELAMAFASDPSVNLAQTGFLTALALGIHNVPEGISTFIATLSSISSGGALAVAICIHNIPEGIAVSMPIYYSTGSKWKALWYGTLAGFPLPIGGLIALGIVKGAGETEPLMFALLYGLTSGMMVGVVIMELLPTGFRYDPLNRWCSKGIAFGFAVMAISLMLFTV